jgi:type IV secretory pathway TraG/TraD family ATPase VirD4
MGDSVANAILTNSNIKVFMRGNDPDSAEYFSKVIGTTATVKVTERRKIGFLNNHGTGDVSAREVEEFVIHPNQFKRELGVGQAIMVVPHDMGARTFKIKFDMFDDLGRQPMPQVEHPSPIILETLSPKKENTSVEPMITLINSKSEASYETTSTI